MDRRYQTPEIHPLVSGFACPSCTGEHVRIATVTEWFFYLRCEACNHIWSHPERRKLQRRQALPDTRKPLKSELLPSHINRREQA